MTKLDTYDDGRRTNIVLVLEPAAPDAGEPGYRWLPILPNNSTGWVQATRLGGLFTVNTHLYVDRAHFRRR